MSEAAAIFTDNTNRQAGRTTASLRHALSLLSEGRNVLYITHTVDMAQTLVGCVLGDAAFRDFAWTIQKATRTEIHSKGGGVLRFISIRQDDRMRGWPAVKIPDHFAYEVVAEDAANLNRTLKSERAEHERTKLELIDERRRRFALEDEVVDLRSSNARLTTENMQLRDAVEAENARLREIVANLTEVLAGRDRGGSEEPHRG